MDQTGVQHLLSRDEVLGGLPARRGSTLLFALERRTAQLMVRTRQAVTRLPTERTAEQHERAFLAALAEGREPRVRPRIQDLERHAAEWAPLVPADPGVRAAVAELLAGKYQFRRQDVPRLRAALDLDTQATARTYERLHHRPIESIFATRSSWRERRRWSQAHLAQRLESLPPFWTVFALTLTEMVGAAILALPTAVAGVGPLVGVALLVVLGVVNMVTIAALSEAFIRDGSVRYGHVYFGRLVANYLGGRNSSRITGALLGLISLLLMAECVGTLLVYSIGVSTTLAAASGVSALFWVVLLLGIVLYFLRRETLDLTIASALVIGGINIGLLILLAVLVLPHVSSAHLLGIDVVSTGSGPFEPGLLGLMFGVIMAAYFGHFSTGTCARLVLSRDPSGRSLVLGNVAAMCVAIVLNCLWVVAVNGTLAPSALLHESGTAINLLAAEVGPIVNVIGVLFVILGMGMGAIHAALALMYQMREWLAAGSGRRSPFLAGAVPTVAIFGLAAWLLTTGASFAGPLGVLGVVAYSVLGGILPALLLLASRRKGDYVPAVAWRVIGHPVVLIGVYALFVASLFVHGLVIWEEPLQRLAALAVGVALIALTILVIWRGALTRRVVVEVRLEHDQLRVSVTDCGRAGRANVRLTGRAAQLELPATLARQLKVWTYRVTPTGDSEGLPARTDVWDGVETRRLDPDGRTGQVLGALSGVPYRVSIAL